MGGVDLICWERMGWRGAGERHLLQPARDHREHGDGPVARLGGVRLHGVDEERTDGMQHRHHLREKKKGMVEGRGGGGRGKERSFS